MIVRLKHDEKPNDPTLTSRHVINWMDPQSDIVWISQDELNRDAITVNEDSEDVPAEIRQFIPKWRQKAIENKDTKRNTFCPIKGAGSDVYYKGEKYYIGKSILEGIGNEYTIDWLFETVSSEIERDMYSIGATYVEYMGTID